MQAPAVQPGRFLFAQDRPPRAAERPPRPASQRATSAHHRGRGTTRHAITRRDRAQGTASPPGERIASHQAHRRRLAPVRAPPPEQDPPDGRELAPEGSEHGDTHPQQ